MNSFEYAVGIFVLQGEGFGWKGDGLIWRDLGSTFSVKGFNKEREKPLTKKNI